MHRNNIKSIEGFELFIKNREMQRRQLPLKAKIKYLVLDFKKDWQLRGFYKKTWILSHINPLKILLFLLPEVKSRWKVTNKS